MSVLLAAPGLLGPLPRGAGAGQVPRPRRLETLLSRATTGPAPRSLAGTLFECFAVAPTLGGSAACSYLAETGEPPPGWACHADPVHLVADQDRVLLFDLPNDPLSAADAEEMLGTFNRHFAEDGLRLAVTPAGGWFVLAERRPDVAFHDLDEVVGRSLDPFLPEGSAAGAWRRFLTETQMLFHGLACNARREAEGCLPVSGLWFSGGGELPEIAAPASVSRAAGPGSLLAGLCKLAQVPLTSNSEVLREGGLLLFDDARRPVLEADPRNWAAAVERFEGVLGEASGAHLVLSPCNGQRYELLPGHRWRWWRRRRELAAFLEPT